MKSFEIGIAEQSVHHHRPSIDPRASRMFQGWRRRRMTTALLVIPGILSVLTIFSAWVLPSSNFKEFLRRFTDDPESNPTLVTKPKISDPNAKAKWSKDGGAEDDNTKSGTSSSSAPTIENQKTVKKKKENWTMIPQELLDLGVYDEASDFINEEGIKPTGWENPNGDLNIWGPCRFVPPATAASVEWNDRRRRPPPSNRDNENTNATMTPDYYRNADIEDFNYLKNPKHAKISVKTKSNNIGGWCRPGFLIIGAGKCGTSSLYHYLIGHPRVLPAVEKQIHYFKYHDSTQPLEWYYGNFPTPQSFLEHGGLVTGEASPGYLPYPEVARNAFKAWKGSLSANGAGMASIGKPLTKFLSSPYYSSMVPEVPPRIIAIGREPFDRIYSSYKYNYVDPTIELLKTKGHPRIPLAKKKQRKKEAKEETGNGNENEFHLDREDDYYLPYLFTLEEFVRAELKQLKGCLYDWGPQKTYNKWNRDSTYREALQLRNRNSLANSNSSSNVLPPLIDLEGICYGKAVNKTVYREQWSEMQTLNPRKVLLNKNLHLTEAFIGRSLYVLPLDWWYENFRPDPDDARTSNSIVFVCTEDLNKPETLNNLTAMLGLPKYDGFDTILAEGAYNVGGHRGYDKATSWEKIKLEQESQRTTNNGIPNEGDKSELSSPSPKDANQTTAPMTNGIPLPEDIYQELKDFVDPLNERLFALTGKRCNW